MQVRVKAHTIRIWEQRYNFLKPQRTETNIRYYTNEELKIILNISLLNKYGFKISHIDRMSQEEIGQRILSLTDSQAIQERNVNELVKETIDLNTDKLDKVISEHIALKGMERTMMKLLFPFLEKIGILWVTGHINPAQEHLVTNLIRQKMMVAIDKTPQPENPQKSVLLFLPEGEYHELGLLFLNYLMKNKGVGTIYAGTNIPFKDVAYIIDLKKPDYIFCRKSRVTFFGKHIHHFENVFAHCIIHLITRIIHSNSGEFINRISFYVSHNLDLF